MEELTEVITSAEFHPQHCNIFMYSSSKGTIKLADMRAAALCDNHAKSNHTTNIFFLNPPQYLKKKRTHPQNPFFQKLFLLSQILNSAKMEDLYCLVII